MKHVFQSITLLLALSCAAQMNAQTQGVLWVGSRSTGAQSNPDVTAIHTMWKNTWDAYQAGDTEKMWAAYTDDAAELGPDGNITFGKKALRESWEAFMKMADKAPTFTYGNPLVRILTSDIALIVWDSEADIQIGGQQVGGKTKGMAVLRKIKGVWKIEFDSLTPVMPMPGGN